MNIKEILSDILPKAELSDENRKTLSDWLDQFEKVPQEQELLQTIDQLKTERDNVQRSLDDLVYKNHVSDLAENYSFSDKGYLEYLCKLNNIDFSGSSDPKDFMYKLQSDAPKFFKINLQSGSGSAVAETVTSHHGDQFDDILTLLNNAPEVRG